MLGRVPLLGVGYTGKPHASLLLHCDGADAGTTFTDSGNTGHTVTAVGAAQLDTAQSKFGGASALFDASATTRLTIPDHADFDLAALDWTLDFWVRLNTLASGKSVIYAASTATLAPFAILTSATHFVFHSSSDGATWDLANAVQIGAAATGEWAHIAAVRSGTSIRLFKDGVLGNTVSVGTTALMNCATGIAIGGFAGGNNIDAWEDEIRLVKGVGHWGAAFTPPTVAYP